MPVLCFLQPVDYDDYDEDYYDDYEDDDMDLEPEKPEKKERVTKSRSERFSARRAATRNDDDIIDDYDEVTAEHEEEPALCYTFLFLRLFRL